MPELMQKERLQLSLLDRLTDDEPDKKSESREKRVISVSRLKELVQRDLGWLMNCTATSAHIDFSRYPDVQSSTLNYGIPDLCGLVAANLKAPMLEREIATCLLRYEPRIIPTTLTVKVHLAKQEMSANTLGFEIQADVWAQPIPLHLFLETDVDIENGHINFKRWH